MANTVICCFSFWGSGQTANVLKSSTHTCSNVQQRCEHIIHTHIYVDTFESPLNLTYERPKEKVPMLMGRREVGSLSLQTDLCQIQEKLTKESEMLFEVMLGTHKMTKFCLHFYNRGQYMNLFSACCLTSATFLAWSCTPSNVCIFYLPVDWWYSITVLQMYVDVAI